VLWRERDAMSDQLLSQTVPPLLGERAARLREVWLMTPDQRVTAMRRGELSLEQCAAWAARHPAQIPLVNGEFEFLAACTPEVCE
jgi:hypothetical protein